MNITISQNKFVKIITQIKQQYDRDAEIGKNVSACGDGSFIFTTPLLDSVVAWLDSITNTGGWIEYYCFELDFGRRGGLDCVILPGGETRSLRNPKELYKFLTNDCDTTSLPTNL